MAKNQIIINKCHHYIDNSHAVKHAKTPIIILIEGICNDVPFSALNLYSEGINSDIIIFNPTRTMFSKSEYSAILRKSKSETPAIINDLTNEPLPEGYLSHFYFFFMTLEQKYYGEKVYLIVPFSEKDEAFKLGAIFDHELKTWFYFSKLQNKETFSKWLIKDIN